MLAVTKRYPLNHLQSLKDLRVGTFQIKEISTSSSAENIFLLQTFSSFSFSVFFSPPLTEYSPSSYNFLLFHLRFLSDLGQSVTH